MFKSNNHSSRSLRRNNKNTPTSITGKQTGSRFSEENKRERRMNYIKRLDHTVSEYESGSTKLKGSIDDGFLSFIGFGK
jgi:hypothetical protein